MVTFTLESRFQDLLFDSSVNDWAATVAMQIYFSFEGKDISGFSVSHKGDRTEVTSRKLSEGYLFFKIPEKMEKNPSRLPSDISNAIKEYFTARKITRTFIDYDKGISGFSWRSK